MSIALTLLGDVRWRGRPVAGDRPQALLAALAARGCRPVRPEELIELVWGEDAPSNGPKSLQVLVSRARNACGADAIVRDGAGYRLGVGAGRGRQRPARGARARRRGRARPGRGRRRRAGAARRWRWRTALSGADDGDDGPLAEVRRAAAADAAAARVILARASSRAGAHAAALPVAGGGACAAAATTSRCSRTCCAARPPSAARPRRSSGSSATAGTCASGSAPIPASSCSARTADLLALDRPVRRGVRYDATDAGRPGRDLARLRALMASRARGLDRRRRRAGQDAAGARRSPGTRPQPVVHVVELVGVTAAEDVVGEVGSVLGVRDSVSGRRALTAEQRADIRARIAQRLAQSPSLLVLDNCEHLIEAVAELVAFLVSAAADLRVLTTSRAPLAIAAERVYLLGELETADAAQLFRERAVAARPSVRLTEPIVASIVSRLDGLPLAIELAAAKVRAMSVEEIDRRLEDRFALLRGGDRSAPDRHQTLLAVIDWSWNLLDAGEQRALRRLALFHDGFTLEAAEAVLGDQRLRRGAGPGRPVAAERRGGPGRAPLPDARDRARVRPDAAGRRPARTPRPAPPSARWAIGVRAAHGAG